MGKPLVFSRRTAGLAALSLLTGCVFQSRPSSGPGFAYLLADGYVQWLRDSEWLYPLQQRTGVPVKFVDGGPSGSYYQKFDLTLAAHGVKDAAIAQQAQVAVYGEQGAFLDLAPLIRKYAPHMQRYIEANPDYQALITNPDGSIYGIIGEYPKISPITFYRADMFRKAGIDGKPRTIAELTEALRKLKKAYSGTRDFYPYIGREALLNLQYAFDAQDRIDASGKVHGVYASGQGNDLYSPGFKRMIEWYHQIYREGLIDPEFVAGTDTEDTWQTKMLNGKGAVSTDFFTRPSYFISNGGPKIDPHYEMGVLPAFRGEDGKQRLVAAIPRYNTERMFVVNKSSDRAEKILKFLDYMHTPAGQTLVHYGIEGKSYKVVNGRKEYTASYNAALAQLPGHRLWTFFQDRLGFPIPVDNDAYYKWSDELTRSFAPHYFANYLKVDPILRYTGQQLIDRSALDADLEPFIDAQVVAFVTGKRPMSQWDGFLRQATARGAKQITAIDQAAYDAMTKK
jgi:putative aldouronate transport system substrate-binding protein